MSDLADSLPIQRAIRLVLGPIAYSNALPPWFEPLKVSYSAREATIRQKVRGYLANEKPKPAFQIKVPKKKGGDKRAWMMPAVNDQIVIQACVSAIAETVYATVDRKQVFSYRYNADGNQLLLAADASESWKEFQEETKRRVNGGAILQFDLENAFGNIDRQKFIGFLESRAPKRPEVSLLDKMLGTLSNGSSGLPVINDSVFFMGNAYLRVVDEVVAKHCANFVRFMDDYRLFGGSRSELETSFAAIGAELAKLGFKVNDSKTKLGSAEEYLEAITQGPSTSPAEEDEYATAVVEDVPSAGVLRSLVTRAVGAPDDLLNEGLGRLSLGAIRVIRSTALMKAESPLKAYQTLISQDNGFVQRVLDLLETYLKNKEEVWRSIWLLYVLADISPAEAGLKQKRNALLDSAAGAGVDDLVRLWARKVSAGETEPIRGQDPEKLDELTYAECGERLWNT